jgi:hypothetical protein
MGQADAQPSATRICITNVARAACIIGNSPPLALWAVERCYRCMHSAWASCCACHAAHTCSTGNQDARGCSPLLTLGQPAPQLPQMLGLMGGGTVAGQYPPQCQTPLLPPLLRRLVQQRAPVQHLRSRASILSSHSYVLLLQFVGAHQPCRRCTVYWDGAHVSSVATTPGGVPLHWGGSSTPSIYLRLLPIIPQQPLATTAGS